MTGDVVNVCDEILSEAVSTGVSDIHIECFKESAQIRFRVDGILRVMKNFSDYLYKEYDLNCES